MRAAQPDPLHFRGRWRTGAACIAVTAVLAVAGCASSTSGHADLTPPTSSSPTSVPASPTGSSGTQTGSSATSTGQSAELSPLLIAATDIGSGFTSIAPDTSENPLPCTPTAKPYSQQFPPSGKAQADFKNAADSVEVSQAIEFYDDSATFKKLISTTEAGFACRTGKLSGTSITIVPVKTPTVDGLDVVKRWDAAITSEGAVATILLLAKKTTAELVTFVAKAAAAKSIDIGDAANSAAAKLGAGAK